MDLIQTALFPNVKEFDIESKIPNLQFYEYLLYGEEVQEKLTCSN